MHSRYMYNYYFIQNVEITLHMHGENLKAIKCTNMFGFILGLKMNKIFLFHHSPNLTNALSQDQVIGIFEWTYMKSMGKFTLACFISAAIESINVKLYTFF